MIHKSTLEVNVRFLLKLSLVVCFILLSGCHSPPDSCAGAWPEWEIFKKSLITDTGRVIDRSSPIHHTTSEGQAYALFFALVANDRTTFDRVLKWTEDNLAQGDLTAHLPAWEWGSRDDKEWAVLDDNTASDADLWIAYALAEAGRNWNNERYHALSWLITNRMVREETASLPNLGLTLLPGRVGFSHAPNFWTLNPSYVPPQLLRYFAEAQPSTAWPELHRTSKALILATGHGFSPDWIHFIPGKGFQPDTLLDPKGSYDAIRVYLWAGLLSPSDPFRAALLLQLQGMKEAIKSLGYPPLEVNTLTGTLSGTGAFGFSAALIPFLNASEAYDLAEEQSLRVHATSDSEKNDAYYGQALNLFSSGFLAQRFRFTLVGRLETPWMSACGN